MLEVLGIHLHFRLNPDQNRVVHYLASSQEVRVFSDDCINVIDVPPRHVDLLDVVLVSDEVLIFQSRRMCRAAFDLPAEQAAFEVVNARYIVFAVEAQRVSHQDQVDLLVILHLHCVNAVDT
jgi:hypothetical protein